MAQIINIMRSKYPTRSLGAILKDKAMFTECILELGAYMEEKKRKREAFRAKAAELAARKEAGEIIEEVKTEEVKTEEVTEGQEKVEANLR